MNWTREHLVDTNASSAPRDRLLEAAKRLFASKGYENASTNAVARLAATSESQLIKHFGSKAGLLEAVFDQVWAGMEREFAALENLPSPRQRLHALLATMITALERDAAVRELLLFEGRRVRHEGRMVLLSSGYMQLVATVDDLLAQMHTSGELRPDLHVQAVRSALLGVAESLMRDQALAQRIGYPATYTSNDIKTIFEVTLTSYLAAKPEAPKPQPKSKTRG